MMKQLFLLLCTLSAVLLFAAEPLTVSIEAHPAAVTAGEVTGIEITANRRGTIEPELPKLDNGEWFLHQRSSSQSFQWINGRTSIRNTTVIPVLAGKPGKIVIPAMTVRVGKASAKTRPLEIRVLAAAGAGAIPDNGAENLAGVIVLPEKRRCYVGEEIPLVLQLTIPAGVVVRELAYPELTGIGNAVFHDYGKTGTENRRFAPVRQQRRRTARGEAVMLEFQTAFRALRPGRITPQATMRLKELVPDRSRRNSPFDDDFFSGFFGSPAGRLVSRQVNFVCNGEPLEILPLPPPPAGAIVLGVPGTREVKAALSSPQAQVGEVVELRLTLPGTGVDDSFRAPDLQIPGFRIYPPAIRETPAGAEIAYAMIPLTAGDRDLKLTFARFDAAAGKYRLNTFSRHLPVALGNPGERVPEKPLPEATAQVPAAPRPPAQIPESGELFYPRPERDDAVRLPLWQNHSVLIVLVLGAGFLAALVLELRERRRLRRQHDENFRSGEELRAERRKLLRLLQSPDCSGDDVRREVVPFLARAMHLPVGTTPGELAGHVTQPELRDYLTALDSSGFCPGGDDSALPAGDALRRQFRRLLKTVLTLLILFGGVQLGGTDRAVALFDRGDYRAAREAYRSRFNAAAPSPTLLYNLGCVYSRSSDWPMARCCFERALLLAPNDHAALNALNAVNRKLMLPERDAVRSPQELLRYCRDRLRPDQYLALAAVAAAVGAVLWSLRRRWNAWFRWSSGVFCLLVVCISLSCVFSQSRSLYSGDRAVITGAGAPLRSLPASSGRIEATIPGGSDARILDRRTPWVRVQSAGQDGWVLDSSVQTLFPGGIF